MAGRIYVDQMTLNDVDYYKGSQNPNGVLTAPAGSSYVDDSGPFPVIWLNLDGGTLWSNSAMTFPLKLTYWPGGSQIGLTFNTWADLMALHDFFLNYPKTILFSNLGAVPVISPSGGAPYNFVNTTFHGIIRSASSGTKVAVRIQDGTQMFGLKFVENLVLERQPGASGLPVISNNAAGAFQVLFKNSSLRTLAGSSAPFIALFNAASDLTIEHESGDLDSQDAAAPIVDLRVAGAQLTWRPIRAALKTTTAIKSVAGSTVWTRFQDGDSTKVRQLAVAGAEYAYGPFPDGGFKVTYSPSNPDPSGFVFNDWLDALDLLQKLPAQIRKTMSIDDTFVGAGNPVIIPTGAHRLPARTWIQSANSRQGMLESDKPILQVANGGTLTSDDAAFRFSALRVHHTGNAAVINNAGDSKLELMDSVLEVRAAATADWLEQAAGQKLTLESSDSQIRKEVGAIQSAVKVGGGVGGDVTLNLMGRTQIRKDVIKSDAVLGTGSVTSCDPTAIVEPQKRLRLAANQVISGPQASQSVRAEGRRLTVISKLQLQGAAGTPKVHQSGIWYLDDAVLPSLGNTIVLDDDSGAPETFTWAAAPGLFQAVLGVDVPTTYAGLVAAINGSSAIYRAAMIYDVEKWTGATAAPGQAVLIYSVNQSVEDVPHQIYGTQTTGISKIVNFDKPMDYSDSDSITMPAAAGDGRRGFGWGSAKPMQDGVVVSALDGRLDFIARQDATSTLDLWQRQTNGNDKIQSFGGLGANPITTLTRLVVGDWTAVGPGAASIVLPRIAVVPPLTPIYIRRKDANAGVVTTVTGTGGELIDGGVSVPLAGPGSAVVMHDGTEWYTF